MTMDRRYTASRHRTTSMSTTVAGINIPIRTKTSNRRTPTFNRISNDPDTSLRMRIRAHTGAGMRVVGGPARARVVKVETALGVGRTKVQVHMGEAGMGAAEIDLVEAEVTMIPEAGMEARREIGRASSLRGASESIILSLCLFVWVDEHVDGMEELCVDRTWPCDE